MGLLVGALLLSAHPAAGSGQSIGTISHIHSVRAFDDLGVSWKKVSEFPEDVSTVTQSSKIFAIVSGNSIYKSGPGGVNLGAGLSRPYRYQPVMKIGTRGYCHQRQGFILFERSNSNN